VLRGAADVHVLVSALIGKRGPSAQRWMAARFGRWRLVVSPNLLAELNDVLHRERFRPRVTVEEVSSHLVALAKSASVVR
jgi:predicted nucleic acid-binding protein